MRIDTGQTAHNDVVRMYAQRVATERRDKEGVSLPGENKESERPVSRVGFGDNTISTGAAALFAINRNLRAARDVIPSVEEALSQVRDRFERLEEITETNNPVTNEMTYSTQQINTPNSPENAADRQTRPESGYAPMPSWPSQQNNSLPDVGMQLDLIA